jgi:hypothetical protein
MTRPSNRTALSAESKKNKKQTNKKQKKTTKQKQNKKNPIKSITLSMNNE